MRKDLYESPLASRYASQYMLHLFSPDMRFQTWRRLWVELARAEHELGLPITAEQVAELEAHVTDIDYDAAQRRDGPCLRLRSGGPLRGGDHPSGRYQLLCDGQRRPDPLPGRSAVSAGADLIRSGESGGLCPAVRRHAHSGLHPLPARPAGDGGQAGGIVDAGLPGDRGRELQQLRRIAAAFGFEKCFSVCGQTYPRKTDSRILNVLSSIAQSAYRMANDIRLLQHDRQVEEPFEKNQIGSSAMAYKRNPMRSERICSLSRYLMADAANAPMTASVQWLERTLDDSANRRISLPEGFLCADAVLRLCQNVTNGLHVNEKIVDRAIREYLPFLATENIMMEAVKRGGDRQELHEKIRQHSMAATARMKEGESCDLLDRLAADPAFGMTRAELDAVMEPSLYIGRCKEQVERLLAEYAPLLTDAQTADGAISL